MTANAVLRSLPLDEFERIQPYLKPVQMAAGQRLSSVEEPLEYLWFPESGAISRLVQLGTGESVEAGIVGNDGMLGISAALGDGHSLGLSVVQIPGTAYVLSAADFHEHVRQPGGPMLDAVMQYAALYISVISQLAACHCLHRIEQRLSRCILTLSDRADSTTVRVTHDTLAEFLGVHRPSVTYALQALALKGIIALERRRILVRDRAMLLQYACECYTAIAKTTDRELERIARLLR